MSLFYFCLSAAKNSQILIQGNCGAEEILFVMMLFHDTEKI